jgi:hypothetical protein
MSDRAHVVASTVLAIVTDALSEWVHGGSANLAGVHAQIENVLRDEFHDIERQASGDRILAD